MDGSSCLAAILCAGRDKGLIKEGDVIPYILLPEIGIGLVWATGRHELRGWQSS